MIPFLLLVFIVFSFFFLFFHFFLFFYSSLGNLTQFCVFSSVFLCKVLFSWETFSFPFSFLSLLFFSSISVFAKEKLLNHISYYRTLSKLSFSLRSSNLHSFECEEKKRKNGSEKHETHTTENEGNDVFCHRKGVK